MKRLWDVLVLTLALNFLAIAGIVGWLYQGGHLDRQRVGEIKKVIFPPPATQPAPAEQTASDPTTQPTLVLETLLARHGNMTAGQQVDFVRKTFDERQAELEHEESMLHDLQTQIEQAQAKLTTDRESFEAQRKRFADEQEQAKKLAADQGFQDALALYSGMPAKQAKSVFLTLGDDVVKSYLEAMDKGTAAKIIKEFKTPDELDRIHRILEKIRRADSASPASAPATQLSKD
jgi:hypothetical protein